MKREVGLRTSKGGIAGMTDTAQTNEELRESILAQPDLILEDPDLMRALIEATEHARASNVVDLRGIAMKRLEARFERLEDTHRNVIAAAYENLSGTHQIHRAVLRMLEPTDFVTFLNDLNGEVADILRVDEARLTIEGDVSIEDTSMAELGHVLSVCEIGFVDAYVTRDRDAPAKKVTLRQVKEGERGIYGPDAAWIRSEACMKLHFGPGCAPGLLCFGSEDPHLFAPSHGTDLLAFFACTVERAMRRWLT